MEHVTPTLRRVLLLLTAALGAYVGAWAAFAPRSFYDSFPGFGFIWISIDGAWNEHLTRDVGTLNLGLAAATLFAAVTRTGAVTASRTIGIAWVVFSLPHLAYHARHLDGLGVADVVAQIVSVSSTGVLGLLLLLDDVTPRRAARSGAQARSPRPNDEH